MQSSTVQRQEIALPQKQGYQIATPQPLHTMTALVAQDPRVEVYTPEPIQTPTPDLAMDSMKTVIML